MTIPDKIRRRAWSRSRGGRGTALEPDSRFGAEGRARPRTAWALGSGRYRARIRAGSRLFLSLSHCPKGANSFIDYYLSAQRGTVTGQRQGNLALPTPVIGPLRPESQRQGWLFPSFMTIMHPSFLNHFESALPA
jgi:hypothetical protein